MNPQSLEQVDPAPRHQASIHEDGDERQQHEPQIGPRQITGHIRKDPAA